MSTHLTLAGLALAAATSATAFFAFTAPASAADPVCRTGFLQEKKTSYLLICRKTVVMSQKGVALTLAQTANCNTSSYWNYGPAVTAKHGPANIRVTVRYKCGHVEG